MRIMALLLTRTTLAARIALAVDMRRRWPARQPSPKKLPVQDADDGFLASRREDR
jgi:hypothetical protein